MIKSSTTLFLILVFAATGFAKDETATFDGKPIRTGHLIAQLKKPAGQPGAQSLASVRNKVQSRAAMRDVRGFSRLPRTVVLERELSRKKSSQAGPKAKNAEVIAIKQEIADLMATGLFEFVEPDYEVRALLTPNDAAFTNGTLWGLRNLGQSQGVSGADIEAVSAWDVTTGSTSVIVAVIDTGIRYTHTDLSANMWVNPGETLDGIDNDGNGYIDDIHGINAITGSGDPMDDNGHGTHCAGTIGAVANGGGQHVGVAWNVRLMALKFLDANGSGSTSDAIECINYAITKGARVLNNSWGGGGFSTALRNAIVAANNANALFVAAAGNESNNNDSNPSYPANYDVANVLSVAALSRTDQLASFSNFGATTVHLGAPGVAIFSTVSTNNTAYATFNGTSMAAPHAAGVAALTLAVNPGLTAAQLRTRLRDTVRPIPALAGRMSNPGSVSAFRAVSFAPTGNLSASVSTTPSPLTGGQIGTLFVSISDGSPVTNASVSAAISGGPTLNLTPTTTPPNGTYSGAFQVPASGAALAVTVSATAPGKNPFSQAYSFPVSFPPTNDNFANAAPILASDSRVFGSNRDATVQTGEPSHAGVPSGGSVWWNWTPAVSVQATITTSGSNFDTVLAVYTGGGVSALTPIASNDDANNTLQSSVTFSAQAGVTYRVAVAGYGDSQGDIVLNVPSTAQPGAELPVFSQQPISRTVTQGELVTFSVVVESSPAASLRWRKDEIDLSDDARISGSATNTLSISGTIENDSGIYECIATNPSGSQPSTAATLTVNSAFVPPLNDNFSQAITLTGDLATTTGTNVNATLESGEPLHGNISGGKSVWWTWVAPVTGEVAADTFGSTFDTTLTVYTGDSVAALNEVDFNDDSDETYQSEVQFFAFEGTPYRIAVDGYDVASGNIELTVRAMTTDSGVIPPDPTNPGAPRQVRGQVRIEKPRKNTVKFRGNRIRLAGRVIHDRPIARVEVRIARKWRKAIGTEDWKFRGKAPRGRRQFGVVVRAIDIDGRRAFIDRRRFRRR